MTSRSAETHYATLGVLPEASRDEIDRAYRAAAKRVHPDNGGRIEDFHRLRHAYEVLSDPVARRRYDEGGLLDAQSDGTPTHAEAAASSSGSDGGARTARVPDEDLPPPPPPPPRRHGPLGRQWPPEFIAPTRYEPPVYITRTNRLAVWAFVLSLLPLWILQPFALVIGIVARVQIQRSGGVQRGGTRAVIAICLSALWIVLRIL